MGDCQRSLRLFAHQTPLRCGQHSVSTPRSFCPHICRDGRLRGQQIDDFALSSHKSIIIDIEKYIQISCSRHPEFVLIQSFIIIVVVLAIL